MIDEKNTVLETLDRCIQRLEYRLKQRDPGPPDHPKKPSPDAPAPPQPKVVDQGRLLEILKKARVEIVAVK